MNTKSSLSKYILLATASILMLVMSMSSSAVPTLQLDIVDGFYASTDETIVTKSDVFSLVAYGNPGANATPTDRADFVADTYYISIALTPQMETLVDFGLFSFDGTTYDHNSVDSEGVSIWNFGAPPLDGLDATPDDELAKHGIFDTFYLELAFQFVDSADTTRTSVNTQDTTGSNPLDNTSGDALFFKTFYLDIAGLLTGFELHFDLYNSSVEACKGKLKSDSGCEDVGVDDFAPFSHDAATVPEPGPLALLSLGLLALMLSTKHRSITKRI